MITNHSLRTPTNLQFSCFFFSSILSSRHCRSWYLLFMKTQHPSGCCERKWTKSELNKECACITWRLVEQFKNMFFYACMFTNCNTLFLLNSQFRYSETCASIMLRHWLRVISNSTISGLFLLKCFALILAKPLKCTMQERLELSYYFIHHCARLMAVPLTALHQTVWTRKTKCLLSAPNLLQL